MIKYKLFWIPLIMSAILFIPTTAFAEITWNNVSKGFEMTDDEYFVDVPEGSTGTFAFNGGKFVNPQGEYFEVVWVHYNKSLGSSVSLSVTFSDGYNLVMPLMSSSNQIPTGDFLAHPSKGITLNFISDGRKDYKAYMNSYSLKDYDGPSATTSPTTNPTTSPTAVPTSKPTATTTPKPSASATVSPSANPSATPDPGDTGGGNVGGGDTGNANCLCAELCEIMPDILAGFGDQLNGISNALAPLHNDLAVVQDQLFGVRDDLQQIDYQAQQINNNTAPLHGDLLQIRSILEETLRQVTPSKYYDTPASVTVPPFYTPPSVGQTYRDNGTYFTDSGDATAPAAMPVAPEPDNWKYNGVTLNQDVEMIPAPKQTKSPEMNREPNMISSPEMQREPEMTSSPQMQREPEMTSSPEMQREPEMTSSPQMQREPEMKVQAEDYLLRWESSEFKRGGSEVIE